MKTTARCALAALPLLLSQAHAADSTPAGLDQIQTIVVIYGENRSFDNLYGLFPGANGIANASEESKLQRDRDGSVMPTLPPVWKKDKKAKYGVAPDPRFPTNLPNGPFRLDAPPVNMPVSKATRDLTHRYYQNPMQIDGGRNDMFVAWSDAGALTMGYYDGSVLPMWKFAKQYVLADNFFMGAFGGSYINHMFLICGCTGYAPDIPQDQRAVLDADGKLVLKPESPKSAFDGPAKWKDGTFSPDGYAINTVAPPYQPSDIDPPKHGDQRLADPAKFPVPPQTMRTIGDTLSDKHVSWKWYAGGFNAALKNRKNIYDDDGPINFQVHHQPFNYFARFAPGTKDRAEHLKDGSDFDADIRHGKLPQVAFYKPQGHFNQHPGYADVMQGDMHIAALVKKLQASPQWKHMAIIVTYDENGGFWDHVAPPKGDKWGPGTRIPAIIISPFAKHGFVDHTQYDTTSIMKFLTTRFGLEPLPGIREQMGDLTNVFEFDAARAN
jgi:phospholipase C